MTHFCKQWLLFIIVLFGAIGCSQGGGKVETGGTEGSASVEESKKVNDFLDVMYDEYIARHPELASVQGIKKNYGDWDDHSDNDYDKELAISKAKLAELQKQFDLNKLDAQTKLSIKLLETQIKTQEEGLPFKYHYYPLTQMGGEHVDIPTFLVNIHTIADTTEARAYISRLIKLDTVFAQIVQALQIRETKGIIPPKFVFPYVSNDIKGQLVGTPFDGTKKPSVLLEDFTTKVNTLKIDAATKNALIADASKALANHVKPAYSALLNYWTQLEKKATTDDGIWKLPNGNAYYAYMLKYHTTTNMSPDEVFELGKKEVARIQNEMRTIMKTVQFKSDSLQEFFNYVRTDPKFSYTNDEKGRNQCMKEGTDYIENMKHQLDKLFKTKPKADIKVMAVEAFREKSATGAFYESPALDGSRPGRYYLNLYNTKDQPIYQMEALAYHEGIPGHHMQIAIAQELQGVPKFRKYNDSYTAYVEGWALYSELIPKEIGFYKDPYSDFGRLSMEIFRAARLVVDVGIHTKKWTRQQAIDYFIHNTANAEGDCIKEIERYIVWPGQATGYKVGMNKILELRQKSEKALGAKFDIRDFHDVCLVNGAVPLLVLEELTNEYIASKK
jgi:uncharacterized protein (DUF885 family)